MRLLFAYSSEPHYMSPPRLSEEQVNCGPYFHDRCHEGRWLSVGTPRGDYDLAKVAERLGADQQPDLVAVHVDGASMAGTPRNLSAFTCPKILLVADTHHGGNPLASMIRYAREEAFDRVVLLYDRHHADLFHAAGIKNLHWLPSLTFAHSDARVLAAAGTPREARIAIVGTTSYHPRRLRIFSALVEKRLPLDWREIHQSESIAHYAGSLIGLNASMNGDLNMRVFEILAGGALLLTDQLAPASGLSHLLREDRDFVGYSSTGELIERASHLLSHPDEARTIAESGARWFRENFTEKHRRQAFLDLAFDGRDRPDFALPPPRVSVSSLPPLDTTVAAYHWTQVLHQKTETVRVGRDAAAPAGLPELFTTLPRVEFVATPPTATDSPLDLWIAGNHQSPPAGKARHVWFCNLPDTALPAFAARLAAQNWRHVAPGVPLFAAPSTAPAEAPDATAAKARTHFQSGDLVGALRQATAALQANPKSIDALFVIAELSLEAQNWDTAASMLARAQTIAPGHPLVSLLRRQLDQRTPPRQARRLLAVARLAFDWRDHLRTRTYATLALEADPACADAHHLLGLLDYHHSGEADSPARRAAAIAGLRRATELNPARADYWLELALAHRRLGQNRDAVTAFRAYLARDPNAFGWLALGETLLALDEPSEAAAAFAAGLALAPDDAALLAGLRRTATHQPHDSPALASCVPTPSSTGPLVLPPDLAAVARLLATTDAPPEEIATRIASAFHERACSPRPFVSAARRVLLAHQPWFEIDTPRLLSSAHSQGLLATLFDETTTPIDTDSALGSALIDAENWRALSHHGIRLIDACRYRLALELRRPACDLDPSAPDDHAALAAFYAHAAALIDKARLHLDCYQPDTVVIAQGHDTLSVVLRLLAVQRGLRVVALENTFRKDRLLWDDVSGVTVNRNLARNHYWRLRELVSDATARATVDDYLGRLRSLKSAEHASPAADDFTAPSEEFRTLVYLAQVGTDSSVQFGLRRFASQADLIVALAAYVAERSIRLVVKLHPKENPALRDAMPWVRGLTADALSLHPAFPALRKSLADRLVLDTDNHHDTYALIRNADVCVTINSQAGLEAAILGREVVLCGDAFYGNLGFTHEADDEAALRFRLDRILDDGLLINHGPDARAFFHIYSEHYCLPKTAASVLALCAGRPADRPAPGHADAYPQIHDTAPAHSPAPALAAA